MFCFPDKSYRKLREDVYAEHSGRCALCGRKIESLKNARVLEKYEPRVETVEINGEKREAKKLALMGMELLCYPCYTVRISSFARMKEDEEYRNKICEIIKNIVQGVSNDEIIEHIKNCEEERRETQSEYDVLSLKEWVSANKYQTDPTKVARLSGSHSQASRGG